jgi:uncharacterized membrane protein
MNYNITDFEILDTWVSGSSYSYQVQVSEDRSVIVGFAESKSDSFVKDNVYKYLEQEYNMWTEEEERIRQEQEQLAATDADEDQTGE